MTTAGWYPDPARRHAQRWHDGVSWTRTVASADGQLTNDDGPVPDDKAAAAAPAPPRPGTATVIGGGPASAPTSGPPGQSDGPPAASSPWAQVPGQPPPPTTTRAPWSGERGNWSNAPAAPPPGQSGGYFPATTTRPAAGLTTGGGAAAATTGGPNPLLLGAAGVALVAWVLSLFVLDWGEQVNFGDLGDFDFPDGIVNSVVELNFSWLAWVSAGITLVAVVALGIAGRRLGTGAWVAVAAVAAIGAAMATLVVSRLLKLPGDAPGIGAWLLPAGYVVVLITLIVAVNQD